MKDFGLNVKEIWKLQVSFEQQMDFLRDHTGCCDGNRLRRSLSKMEAKVVSRWERVLCQARRQCWRWREVVRT